MGDLKTSNVVNSPKSRTQKAKRFASVKIAILSAPLLLSACANTSDALPDLEPTAESCITLSDGQDFETEFNTESRLCEVTGVLNPVEGSNIGFVLHLPIEGWNGRIVMIGNGGYSSSINTYFLDKLSSEGYAALATDTGHSGDDPDFVFENPEALIDWSHRAVHETIVAGNAIATQFYDQSPDYKYFTGCSTGGHQALKSVQMYPDDFDGVLAGAPGHNRTHLNVGFLWQFVSNQKPDQSGPIIPASKLPFISSEIFNQCRGQNGGIAGGLGGDNFLNNPLLCDIDYSKLSCEQNADAACLTPPQLTALKKMHDGAANLRTGEKIYFGFTPGSEASGGPAERPGWSLYWSDPRDATRPARESFWRYWAFDEDWEWTDFDFDASVKEADAKLADTVNAMSADLSKFYQAGGKLLMFHGFADPVVPVEDSIFYFNRLQGNASAPVDDYARLFLVPGMNHCSGGDGPFDIDFLTPLRRWVEDETAPEELLGRHRNKAGEVTFSRPVCAYPNIAVAQSAKDGQDGDAFVCKPGQTPEIIPPASEYIQ